MTRAPNDVLTVLAADRAIARAMGSSRRQVLTALYLALPVDALELLRFYRLEITSGRFSPDPALVFSLFRAIDRKGKIALATSFCGSALDSPDFMKLISRVYRTCSPKGLERHYLATAISRHASLYWNISAPGYEELVRKLLYSRRGLERMHGPLSLESLSGAHPDLCLRLVQLVRDRLPYVRGNAWAGAHTLLYWGRLTADAHELLLRESLAALKDKDELVRRNARLFRRRSRQWPPGAKRDVLPRRRRVPKVGVTASGRLVPLT